MPMNEEARKVWEHYFKSKSKTRAQDHCTAWIDKAAHGRGGDYGWEIDHIVPRSQGGSDALSNKRPLHWKNNDAKGGRRDGQWRCAVVAKRP